MTDLIIVIAILGTIIYFVATFIEEHFIAFSIILGIIIIASVAVIFTKRAENPPSNGYTIEKINLREMQSEEKKPIIKALKRSANMNHIANVILCFFPILTLLLCLIIVMNNLFILFTVFSVLIFIIGIILKILVKSKFKVSFEGTNEQCQNIISAFCSFYQSRNVWEVFNEKPVANPKDNAGKNKILGRFNTQLIKKLPPYIKCNSNAICIKINGKFLIFLSNIVIIKKGNNFGIIDIDDLEFMTWEDEFIEDNIRPIDAQLSKYTWQHVNKSGRQDLRYKDNPTFPVYLYGFLELSYSDCLYIKLICSNHEKIQEFEDIMFI